MSLRQGPVFFADFVELTLFSLFFLLPLPNCFLRVCLLPLFATVLNLFFQQPLQFLSQKFPTSQHLLVLQVEKYFFLQKWSWDFPNHLCKCTQSPSTLLTTTSIEWSLYLSRSNHLVTSFALELKVGGFSKDQNKTGDTDR